MCRNESTRKRATKPIGRFIKKIQRQPVIPKRLSIPANIPPISGPSTEDIPNTARNIPWYLALSLGGTMSARMVSAKANKPPAPIPWIALNAASSYIEEAKPEITEPTTKIEIAVMNRYLLPKMSPSFP